MSVRTQAGGKLRTILLNRTLNGRIPSRGLQHAYMGGRIFRRRPFTQVQKFGPPRPRDAGERDGSSAPQTALRSTTRLGKPRDEIFNKRNKSIAIAPNNPASQWRAEGHRSTTLERMYTLCSYFLCGDSSAPYSIRVDICVQRILTLMRVLLYRELLQALPQKLFGVDAWEFKTTWAVGYTRQTSSIWPT